MLAPNTKVAVRNLILRHTTLKPISYANYVRLIRIEGIEISNWIDVRRIIQTLMVEGQLIQSPSLFVEEYSKPDPTRQLYRVVGKIEDKEHKSPPFHADSKDHAIALATDGGFLDLIHAELYQAAR